MTTDELARELADVWLSAIERIADRHPGAPLFDEARGHLSTALTALSRRLPDGPPYEVGAEQDAAATRWLSLASGGWLRLIESWPIERDTKGEIAQRIRRLVDNDRMALDRAGLHRHKCDVCGFVWAHGKECVNNETAHTCGQCGAFVSELWQG